VLKQKTFFDQNTLAVVFFAGSIWLQKNSKSDSIKISVLLF